MAQLNNTFTYSALDTSTAPWTPITGLTNVRFNLFKINRNSSWVVTSWTQVVTDWLCVEIGWGGYAYTYTWYSPSLEYYYYITPNDSRCYVEQGATDPIEQLISEVRGGWGGGSINISGIQTTIRNARDTIVQEIGKAKDETLTSISETNSHIDIAKWEITDKIESIEIPELEEKEAKKVLKIVTDTSKTLKSYIDSEMKEKDDIKEISSEFLKLEKEEKEREMKEKEEEKMKEEEDKRKEEEEKKKEAENDAKLLEEIQKEFDAMEEEDKQEKKKELEQELKELEKEMKEKEKELNSIK